MPVYTVTMQMGLLDLIQKQRLAAGITSIHTEETGAPEALVHVMFMPYPRESVWTSARPSAPVFVDAWIRAGRSAQTRVRILQRISDLICTEVQIPARDVLVCLSEVPAQSAMVGGMVTPTTDPEAEAEWFAELRRRFPVEQYR